MQNNKAIIFGEVLFDYFPNASILGGAPFNVAWHLQAFGVNPLFISKIGQDKTGQSVKKAMLDWGMDISGLQEDKNYTTGQVTVNIIDNEPHFEILDNQAYDYIEKILPEPLPQQGLLYNGTLALRHAHNQQTLAFLKEKLQLPVFVDINLRPPWTPLPIMQQALLQARWLKVNHEEIGQLIPNIKDLSQQAQQLLKNYQLEWVLVTKGSQGASLFTQDGLVQDIKPEQKVSIVDTVGAGDAFSSVMLYALLHKWDSVVTLQRAQAFASKVVTIRGATPDNMDFYWEFLESWKN